MVRTKKPTKSPASKSASASASTSAIDNSQHPSKSGKRQQEKKQPRPRRKSKKSAAASESAPAPALASTSASTPPPPETTPPPLPQSSSPSSPLFDNLFTLDSSKDVSLLPVASAPSTSDEPPQPATPTVVTVDAPTAPELISSAQMTQEELLAVSFVDSANNATKRYFTDSDIVCNSCKSTGHTAKECTEIICSSCGAIDSHTTRECTVSLICYRCGGRGHRSMQCHIKQSSRRQCEICGSSTHPANACDSIWRRYRYIREENFLSPLDDENEKDDDWLQLWCYNCAADTHLGDDCVHPRGHPFRLENPTAFGKEVYQTGPYWNRVPEMAAVSKTGVMHIVPTRTYSQALPDGMDSVGRMGRERNRRRMERSNGGIDDGVDTGPDWFSARNNINIPAAARSVDNSRSRRERERERERRYPVASPSSNPRNAPYQRTATSSSTLDRQQYTPFVSDHDIDNSDQEDWATLQGRIQKQPPISFPPADGQHGIRSAHRSKRGRFDEPITVGSGKISFKFPQQNDSRHESPGLPQKPQARTQQTVRQYYGGY